jgi:hypothetical protein
MIAAAWLACKMILDERREREAEAIECRRIDPCDTCPHNKRNVWRSATCASTSVMVQTGSSGEYYYTTTHPGVSIPYKIEGWL